MLSILSRFCRGTGRSSSLIQHLNPLAMPICYCDLQIMVRKSWLGFSIMGALPLHQSKAWPNSLSQSKSPLQKKKKKLVLPHESLSPPIFAWNVVLKSKKRKAIKVLNKIWIHFHGNLSCLNRFQKSVYARWKATEGLDLTLDVIIQKIMS